MPRKSSVTRLPADVKKHIERRLREDRLTLSELIADLQTEFPDVKTPSRSALGRYGQAINEMIGHEREIGVAAEALVRELGENFDEKSGALLAQAVTTLASRAALSKLQSDEPLEISDVLDLARATKATQEARSLNLRERQTVAKLAREKLIEEQKAALDAANSHGGVSEETRRAIREVLGIV